MVYHWNNGDEACKHISETLKSDGVSKIILTGEAGIGKTWMARKICEFDSYYIAFWLSLSKEFDEMSLYEEIAFQLSVFLEDEDSGDEDDSDEDDSDDEAERKNRDLMRLKDSIQKKLWRKRNKHKGKKCLLLVLDDAGSVTTENKVLKDFYLAEFLAPYGPLKILLTKRKEDVHCDGEIKSELSVHDDEEIGSAATDELSVHSDEKNESHATDEMPGFHTIEISRENFSDGYMKTLLESLIEDGLLESLEKAWRRDSGDLKQRIVKMSMRLPAAVVVFAKSTALELPVRSFELKELFISALDSSFPPDVADCGVTDTGTSRPNPLIHLAYALLTMHDTRKSSIVDCFWHSLSFFDHCGCVYYQELIAHWILEGYFDPVKSVKKAYKDGYNILMELLNRGFLKIQEYNLVMPEVAMKNLIDLRRRGLSGRSRIGLGKVCGSDSTKGLGKISQVDDTMEAVRGTRKGAITTTVLVSGDRLRRVTTEKYFAKLGDLEVLGLFEPTLDPPIPTRKELEKLRVLVIRDCDLLDSIEDLKYLKGLNALEVSGASSLKEISHTFFKALTKLQSLHLSGLQITFSPSSISDLLDLHCLIIRDCPLLEDLPDIQGLVKLEVVDISGARGLQTCFDNTKGDKKNESKNKNFCHLTKLQLLDFSESQIERLPIFQDSAVAQPLHSVTRLLLRDCSKLRKLPSLKPLSGLQILDLSGTTSLVKMFEVCFEDKKELRTLDLSGTNLSELATTIEELSNLNNFLLRDCTNLEVIPNIQKLINLEVIDVSGCTKLREIEGSFEKMHYLREVDLSGTQITILPESLPNGSNIHCVKRLTLADGTTIVGKNWEEVKAAMPRKTSDEASSSNANLKSQKGPEKKPEEEGVIKPDEPSRPSDVAEEGDVSKERLLQVPKDKGLYNKTLSVFDSASYVKVMEINETSELNWDTLADAEFLSFVDITSTRLTSIFDKAKSVKGCWLAVCLDIMDIKDLFAGVADESLESLETLSITNFPSLETISCGGRFKNLKNLSIDCCPKIKTIFPEASQLPSTLSVLHIKHCETFEKVVEGVEASALTGLEVTRIPESKESPDISGWVMVDPSEALP